MTTNPHWIVWNSSVTIEALPPGSDPDSCPDYEEEGETPDVLLVNRLSFESSAQGGQQITTVSATVDLVVFVSSRVYEVYLLPDGTLRLDGVFSEWPVGTRILVISVVRDATGAAVALAQAEFDITSVPMSYCLRARPIGNSTFHVGQAVTVSTAATAV